MRPILALIALAGLAACASPGVGASTSAPANTYAAELDRLERDCTARNGFLAPLGRGGTGQASTDYACTIRGATPNRTGR